MVAGSVRLTAAGVFSAASTAFSAAGCAAAFGLRPRRFGAGFAGASASAAEPPASAGASASSAAWGAGFAAPDLGLTARLLVLTSAFCSVSAPGWAAGSAVCAAAACASAACASTDGTSADAATAFTTPTLGLGSLLRRLVEVQRELLGSIILIHPEYLSSCRHYARIATHNSTHELKMGIKTAPYPRVGAIVALMATRVFSKIHLCAGAPTNQPKPCGPCAPPSCRQSARRDAWLPRDLCR